MIGKLKHTLKERCPECGKNLQLREVEVKSMESGFDFLLPEELICCSNKNCEFEREVEKKRRRRKDEEIVSL
jgi:ssDNA-binding Zn-finger/Zn-ribbon topoisomerase 1